MPAVEGAGLILTVDPVDGGRITSLAAHGREWLAPSVPRQDSEGFVAAGTGGWDEAVPTVEPCLLPDGTVLRDHGDVWRRPWSVIGKTTSFLEMEVELDSLPVTIKRRIERTAEGMRLSWVAATRNDERVPLLWSAHPLFRAPRGTRIITGAGRLTLEHPTRGAVVETPLGIDAIPPGGVLKGFVPATGAAMVVHADGFGVRFAWDPSKLPYLGLYWDRGVFTTTPVVALEPTTGASDSATRALARLPEVLPGRPLTWWIEVSAVGLPRQQHCGTQGRSPARAAKPPVWDPVAGAVYRHGTAGKNASMTSQPGADSPRKDPEDWVTGDEPATAAQRSYLETLAHDTGAEVPGELTKAQASELIDRLRQQSPRVPSDDS